MARGLLQNNFLGQAVDQLYAFDDLTDGDDWVNQDLASGTAIFELATTNLYPGETGAFRLQQTGTGSLLCRAYVLNLTPYDMDSNVFHMQLYIPEALPTNTTMTLNISSDNGGLEKASIVFNADTWNGLTATGGFGSRTGLLNLSWQKADMTITGAMDFTAVNQMKFTMLSTLPSEIQVNYFGGGRSQSKMLVHFDNCIDSQYTAFTTYFEPRGIVGTVNVYPELIGDSGRLTQANLDTMEAAGWQISSRVYGGGSGALDLSALTDAQVIAILDQTSSWLSARGYDTRFITYSGQENPDTRVQNLVATKFDVAFWARALTTNSLANNVWEDITLGVANEFVVNRAGVGTGYYSAQILPRLDRAIQMGLTMPLYFKGFVTSGPAATEMTFADLVLLLDGFLAYKNTGQCNDMTSAEWWDGQNVRRGPS